MQRDAGKLIVIEGTDGSGKATQAELLTQWFQEVGVEATKVSFPDYDNTTSTLVRMYLAGEFGSRPDDVNPYAASVFYSVDRFGSYKTRPWGALYRSGGVVVADRYTTSNAVHQAGKLPVSELKFYLQWLFDLEYHKICIPEPDAVIYLDMPEHVTKKLMQQRIDRGEAHHGDIHERDLDYMARCRRNGLAVADLCGWTVLPCSEGDEPRDIGEIHRDVCAVVSRILNVEQETGDGGAEPDGE